MAVNDMLWLTAVAERLNQKEAKIHVRLAKCLEC